jgi:hypothetical protein
VACVVLTLVVVGLDVVVVATAVGAAYAEAT